MSLHIKTIVVPLDFSPLSDEALEVAIEYALSFKAELHLVYVLNITRTLLGAGEFVWSEQVANDLQTKAQSALTERGRRCRDKGVVSHAVVVGGDPADQILLQAEEKRADMIIMGTKGMSGLERVLIGSVAERVVAGSKCPVLVVPGAKG